MRSLFLLIFLLIFSYSNAHAYLDPGSTGIILQAIAAIVAGISTVIYFLKEKTKAFFRKVKTLIKKKK